MYIFCFSDCVDTRGTSFAIMFLDGLSNLNELLIYPGAVTTSFIEVNLTAPRTGYNQTVYLEQGVRSVSITIPQTLQTGSSTDRYDGGILITSSSGIRVTVAQHLNGQPISTYVVYPVNTLGSTYYAATYYPPGYHFNIGIVATLGQTTVRISLPENNLGVQILYNGVSYTDGQQLVVQLSDLEVLQVVDGNNANTGKALLIQADQPIAVFVANKDVPTSEEAQGATDTMTTQIPPLHALGTRYHIATAPNRTIEETCVIQAVRNGTSVTVSGQPGVMVLNQADMSSFNITTDSTIQ